MRITEVLHIIGGSLGLAAGYVALFTAKGALAHRRAGTLFVVAMLTMTGGALLDMLLRLEGPAVNYVAALLTTYLVATGAVAVRAPRAWTRQHDVGALLAATAIGLGALVLGLRVLRAPAPPADGIPAFPYFLFATIGLLGAALDVRMLRAGAARGAARVGRHLWRMTTALLIAALSFFLGQSDEFPAALRIPALLAAPVVVVLVALLYWVWRVSLRRRLRAPRARPPVAVAE
ncbi:MAG TPA: hypothetical protein VEA99_10150 [Gemmatimonadaceae bacterium]|nr:hypothetical protein [Gemmatimonadaceae bacterium]